MFSEALRGEVLHEATNIYRLLRCKSSRYGQGYLWDSDQGLYRFCDSATSVFHPI
jgi:hypothetical protein